MMEVVWLTLAAMFGIRLESYAQVGSGPVDVFSREFSVNNFPDPITRAFSRELSVINAAETLTPGNIFSREFSIDNFRTPVVKSQSREISLNVPMPSAPITNIWSRENSLNNFPTGITKASSREFSLGKWVDTTTPNTWSRETTLNNLFIPVTSMQVESGTVLAGGIGSLTEADSNYLKVRSNPSSSISASSLSPDPIAIRAEFLSTVLNPSRIEIQLYGKSDREKPGMTIELFAWNKNRFIGISNASLTTSDTRIIGLTTQSPSQFVNQTSQRVRARIKADNSVHFQLWLDQTVMVVSR